MLLPELQQYLSEIEKEFDAISPARKGVLHQLENFIKKQSEAGQEAKLVFICTHNSRRSHMGQAWAQAVAAYYQVQNVQTYSGGTEATAFNPRAVKALAEAGFKITQEQDNENPVYRLQYTTEDSPIKAFSKIYDHAENPTENFAAIMTCSEADEACPFIPGATVRLPIRYEDPKKFDGTELETEKYSERSRQIAREMAYVFSRV